jgi:hypothetical protein
MDVMAMEQVPCLLELVACSQICDLNSNGDPNERNIAQSPLRVFHDDSDFSTTLTDAVAVVEQTGYRDIDDVTLVNIESSECNYLSAIACGTRRWLNSSLRPEKRWKHLLTLATPRFL